MILQPNTGKVGWRRLKSLTFFITLFLLGVGKAQTLGTSGNARPEILIQTGHSHSISAITFSPDGRLIATASLDKTVRLWETESNREVRVLTGHTDTVNSVAFSSDGRLLASGSTDLSVRIWEVETGNEVQTISGYRGAVYALVFSPDNKFIVIGGNDPKHYEKNEDITRTLEVWDLAQNKLANKLYAFRSNVSTVAFSPDGHWLAAAGFLYPERHYAVRLWETNKWKSKRTFGVRDERITSIAFSNDGRLLASAGKDKLISIIDTETGSEIRSLAGHTQPIMAITFSSMGLLASRSADTTVKLWTVGGKEIATLSCGIVYGVYGDHAVAFSPDGKTLAWADVASVKLMNVVRKQEVGALTSSASILSDALFRTDGKRLLTRGTHVENWDLVSGNLSRSTGTTDRGTLSVDGRLSAFANEDNSISVVDIDTDKLIAMLSGHARTKSNGESNAPWVMSFSHDGRTLATSDLDGVTKLWDIQTRRELRSFSSYKRIGGYDAIENHAHHSCFSPDGRFLAIGNYDNTVELWDVGTGTNLKNFTMEHKFGLTSAAFSPDGRWLAQGVSGFDSTVKIWDAASGVLLHTLTGHTGGIYGVTFSPDGRLLASASEDKTVKVWDVSSGTLVKTLAQHPSAVNFVSFSPDQRFLLSGSGGGLRIWELESGDLQATLISLRGGDGWICITPDGLFDGSPRAWSQILWRFSTKIFDVAPAEVFFNEFYSPNLLADIFAGKHPRAEQDISRRDRRQPRIAFAAEGQLLSKSERTIKLKIEATEAAPDRDHESGSHVRDVRLFRNGSLVRVWHGDLALNDGKATLEATIPIIAGENHLTAYAFNSDNIKSGDATLTITGADNLRRMGTAYILAVGVNNYANAQYNLKYAVADAKAFGEEFRRQQLKLGRFANVEFVPLFDKDATKVNILLALKRLAGLDDAQLPAGASPALQKLHSAQPEDAVIVYFAGHGTAQQNQFFLVPQDLGYQGSRTQLDRAALDIILSHSISDRELEHAFEQVDAGQLLFIIDACNSGQALEAEEKRRGPMNSKGLAQLAYEKGMYILAAAQSYQTALETPQHGHGYLTYALIEEGLKTANADTDPRDGQVTVREWLDYATQRVPQIQEEDARRPKQSVPTTHEQTAQQKPQRTTRPQRGRQSASRTQQQEADKARQFERDKPQAPATVTSEDKFLQQPRVFYRREVEPLPLIVARPLGQ